jgi:hypothetical protein
MSIINHWRNKQLGNRIASQEIKCFNWLNKFPNITWAWYGVQGNFFNFCKENLQIANKGNDGLIIINYPTRVSPGDFVHAINLLSTNNIQAAYLAVNRFEFKALNDLNIDYPDDVGDSLDLIVKHCNLPFERLNNPVEVDGMHFVGAHGLDVFVYARN